MPARGSLAVERMTSFVGSWQLSTLEESPHCILLSAV